MHPGAQRRGRRLAGAFEWSDECGQHPRAMLLPEPSAQRRSYPKESRETDEKNERGACAARCDACDHGREGRGWRLRRRRRCVLRAAADLILRRERLVERRSARPHRRRARQPAEAERRHRVHPPIEERLGRPIEGSGGGHMHGRRRIHTGRRDVRARHRSNWAADGRRSDAARVIRATDLHRTGSGLRDPADACRWLLRVVLDHYLCDQRRGDELGRLHGSLRRGAYHCCRSADHGCRSATSFAGDHWFHGSGRGSDDLRRRGGDGLHDLRRGHSRRRRCRRYLDHRNGGRCRDCRDCRDCRCRHRGRSRHLHGRERHWRRRRRRRLGSRN